ncbi:MAG: DUF362 domain-containing protein, partial [Anaerolineae bacterium]
LDSDWGHLFRNWEQLQPNASGFPEVGRTAAELQRTGLDAFWRSFGILWTTLKEAPEIAARRRFQPAAHD